MMSRPKLKQRKPRKLKGASKSQMSHGIVKLKPVKRVDGIVKLKPVKRGKLSPGPKSQPVPLKPKRG